MKNECCRADSQEENAVKKMLMLATVPYMIGEFNIANLQLLKSMNWKVEVACNFKDRSIWTEERVKSFQKQLKEMEVTFYQIDFSRNPLNLAEHVKAVVQLNNLMKFKRYAFIHCHTPIAGAIGRIVAHKYKIPAVYTAHGFHFYKGAPLKNWLIFYPVEKILSRFTDILITINREDYKISETFHAKKVKYIPGIGVDVEKFQQSDSMFDLRKILEINKDATIILSVGELNKNKNHEIILKAMTEMDLKNVYYVICGIGEREHYLRKLAENLGIQEHLFLLGYRTDIKNIYLQSDLFVFPSIREGLSVALMEAMASGLPCVCSNIRGNKDLIVQGKGGSLISDNDEKAYAYAIEQILSSKDMCESMSVYNKERIKKFDKSIVDLKMRKTYEEFKNN